MILLDAEGPYLGANLALSAVVACGPARKLSPRKCIVAVIWGGVYWYRSRLFSMGWSETKDLSGSSRDMCTMVFHQQIVAHWVCKNIGGSAIGRDLGGRCKSLGETRNTL